MDSLIKELEKPKRFDVFVQEQMKNSTYKPLWKDEITTIDYEASRTYRAAIAEYSAAMVGSVIDKSGEKPTHTMPSANELVGSISHMGDEWQMETHLTVIGTQICSSATMMHVWNSHSRGRMRSLSQL